MGKVKETEFFDLHFQNSTEWYERHFPQANDAVGEISSNYYLDPEVAGRILQYDPSMRLILNLRNPYTLLKSFYGFGIRRGLELPPLGEALDLPVGKFMGSGFEQRRKNGTLSVGDEVTLLQSVCLFDRFQPFLDQFAGSQIHFLVFESIGDGRDALANLYKFLGVDHNFVPPQADTVINAAVEPKSKLVAKLATGTAFWMRRLGAYGLLSRLHQSQVVKSILFRAGPEESEVDQIRESLPEGAAAIIDQQIDHLIDLHPDLTTHWQAAVKGGYKTDGPS